MAISKWFGSLLEFMTAPRPCSIRRGARRPRSSISLAAKVDVLETRTLLSGNPMLVSIDRIDGAQEVTSASDLSFEVHFSETVTGVDISDFQTVSTGDVTFLGLQITGGGSHYVVTATDVSGNGTLSLKLINDDSIIDFSGNPLQLIGNRADFLPAQIVATRPDNVYSTGGVVGDLNNDGHVDIIGVFTDLTSQSPFTFAAWLGNGDGTFQRITQLIAADADSDPEHADPRSISLGDLNADNRLDLVINYAYGSSSEALVMSTEVLLGNGDGTFQEGVMFHQYYSAFDGEYGDFNEDGHLDLVQANGTFAPTFFIGDGTVRNDHLGVFNLWLGNGDGSLQPVQYISTREFNYDLDVADLNGDGHLDVVTVESRNTNPVTGTVAGRDAIGTVSIHLGNGDGTFQPWSTIVVNHDNYADQVIVADMNVDGVVDLVVNASGSLGVLLGRGDGTFEPIRTSFLLGSFLRLADVNGDELPDALYSTNDGSFRVMLSEGDGTFAPEQVYSDVALAQNIGAIALLIADVNEDTQPDVLVWEGASLNLLLNDSGRRFTSESYTVFQAPRLLSITREQPASEAAADNVTFKVVFSRPVTGVDATDFRIAATGSVAASDISLSGSGNEYLVTVSGISGAGTLGLVLTDDESILDAEGRALKKVVGQELFDQSTAESGTAPASIARGDFNGDGVTDVIVSKIANGTPHVRSLIGNGDGTFDDRGDFPVLNTASIAVGDLNADGKLDLVVGHSTVLLGQGDGTFQVLLPPAGSESEEAALYGTSMLGEFNEDGRLDLISSVRWSTPDPIVTIRLGNGDGTFESPILAPNTGSRPFLLADLNGDGHLDRYDSGYPYDGVLLGNGDGTFQARLQNLEIDPWVVKTADIDHDQIPDLITYEAFGAFEAGIAIRLGNGDGTFKAKQQFTVPARLVVMSLDLGDFDGDGNLDVFLGGQPDDWPLIAGTVIFGDGLGNLEESFVFKNARDLDGIVIDDFNDDGRADVVAVSAFYSTVTVLLNTGANAVVRETYEIVGGDSVAPTSSVSALPAMTTAATFVVSWSGADDSGGSGIASYDIYVSDNGAPFTAFLTGTTLMSANFTGLDGHTYSFYSVATDNVGNRQTTPTAAQASTTLQLNQAPTAVAVLNATTVLAENTNTGMAIELGEIAVSDDEFGTNSLSLSGNDAAYFDIVSGRLVVRPGTVLDYETKSSYSVVIEVDDPAVGNRPDAFLNYVLNLTDVDEVVPMASFAAVSPNPRLTPVGTVTLNFSEAVSGVDTSDLTLTRNGQAVSLAGLSLLPGVGGTYTIDLSSVTAQGGEYLLTLNAAGSGIVDAAGNALAANATVGWTNHSITGFTVQKGEAQRSFVRYLDVSFGTQTGLDALLTGNRIRLMRYDLNGANGAPVSYGTVTRTGSTLQFDFGLQGIGGNRNSINGDGYYVLEFDLDNNAAFESSRRFYRLLGDVNGSRKVDATDVNLVKAQIGKPYVAAYDVNGDGIVDARDVVIIQRSLNRQLNSELVIDG